MSTMASQITILMINYSTLFFSRRSKKTSVLCIIGLCEGNSPVTGEFPLEGPVTWKFFSFDIIMNNRFEMGNWVPYQYKDNLTRYEYFYYKDQVIVWLSCPYNGNSYTSMMTFSYRSWPLLIVIYKQENPCGKNQLALSISNTDDSDVHCATRISTKANQTVNVQANTTVCNVTDTGFEVTASCLYKNHAILLQF